MRRVAIVLCCVLGMVALRPTLAQAEVRSSKATQADLLSERWGLGASTSNAPLGLRKWFGERALDVALGLVINGKTPDVDGEGTMTTADYALDIGGVQSLYRSDNSILYGRVGLNIDRRYAAGADEQGAINSSVWTLSLGPQLGMELFLTALGWPEISLQGAVSFNFAYVMGAEANGERPTDWALGTVSNGLNLLGTAQFGFRYYFDL